MSYEIYPQLTEFGHVDLALRMLRSPDYPGLAQSIRDHDATTIFEMFRQDSWRAQMGKSLNHHAMNHPTAWMLNYLAGIRPDPAEPGFRRILLAPHLPKDLAHVAATMQTAYGTVRSAWQQQDGRVSWTCTIPPNGMARVQLPPGVNTIRMDQTDLPSGTTHLELGAGTYHFTWSR